MGRDITTREFVCGTCDADSVIQIDLTLADGTAVSFNSCHQCETRWWNRDGEDMGLDAVRDLARRPNDS